MPTYKAPLEDVHFLLNDVFQIDRYDNLPGFSDASADVREAILAEAAKLSEEVLQPLNRVGDLEGCTRHDDGSVTTPKGFKEAFRQVAESFPGTDAATVATYQLGSELLLAKRPAEAQQAFHTVATSGSAFYASLARLGEAEALMAQNKQDEALKIYTDLAADRNGTLPTDGLLMELARAAQKAGKPQDARAAFKRVVDEFPDSGYAADAKAQLAALK